jgi:hypothetical protein
MEVFVRLFVSFLPDGSIDCEDCCCCSGGCCGKYAVSLPLALSGGLPCGETDRLRVTGWLVLSSLLLLREALPWPSGAPGGASVAGSVALLASVMLYCLARI